MGRSSGRVQDFTTLAVGLAHRQAGVASSSPEWKQLSKQLLVSLHSQDPVGRGHRYPLGRILCGGLLSFLNESLVYKSGLQSCLPGLCTRWSVWHLLMQVPACAHVCTPMWNPEIKHRHHSSGAIPCLDKVSHIRLADGAMLAGQ